MPDARMPEVPASVDELARIEARLQALFGEWQALPDKGALELLW